MTDTQILAGDELSRLPECINAMQNSSGGVIRIEGGRELRVEALEWYEKPAVLDGRVWRRIEGQNVMCGAWARSVMASRDACDDFPSDEALCDDDIDSFRAVVLGRNEEYSHFTREEFLRRAGVYSGGHVTSAGVLMFGDTINVRAELEHDDIHAEIDARNIWEAYTIIIPRITRPLSAKSADNVRSAFITALLHADYSLDTHINVFIRSQPPRVEIDAPGIITPSLRNHRLARILKLAGITAGTPESEHDMLNFRTLFTIHIEGLSTVKL